MWLTVRCVVCRISRNANAGNYSTLPDSQPNSTVEKLAEDSSSSSDIHNCAWQHGDMFTQAPSPTPTQADPWLNLDQAAAVADLRPSTVRRACREGKLRHARVSGRRVIRVRRSWLDQWLEACVPVEAVRR